MYLTYKKFRRQFYVNQVEAEMHKLGGKLNAHIIAQIKTVF